MEFIKRHKIAMIIGAIIIVALIIWWWYSSKSTTVVDSGIKTKIANKMAEIKANTEWYNNISQNFAQQGVNENQGLALNAIYSLKQDGIIPMDTFGVGLTGHSDYVKDNY